jgi:hypothetical protein
VGRGYFSEERTAFGSGYRRRDVEAGVAQLVASQLTPKINFVDARLMAPLFVPLAVAAAVALERRPALVVAAVQVVGGVAFALRA